MTIFDGRASTSPTRIAFLAAFGSRGSDGRPTSPRTRGTVDLRSAIAPPRRRVVSEVDQGVTTARDAGTGGRGVAGHRRGPERLTPRTAAPVSLSARSFEDPLHGYAASPISIGDLRWTTQTYLGRNRPVTYGFLEPFKFPRLVHGAAHVGLGSADPAPFSTPLHPPAGAGVTGRG